MFYLFHFTWSIIMMIVTHGGKHNYDAILHYICSHTFEAMIISPPPHLISAANVSRTENQILKIPNGCF